jgi:DNA-binding SARP family transcriptional activator
MTTYGLSALQPGMAGPTPVLHLFGGPYMTVDGRRFDVPEGSKRLLVYVALQPGRIERRCAAGALWPDGGDARASGNLRSALWRLRAAGIDLIEADKWSLRLCDVVVVDVHVLSGWATRLIGGAATNADLVLVSWWADALDLLPGWYDDWALLERERVRQRMLHALEALSGHLVRAKRCAEAVEAAMMAVSAEPLRESAQRALIQAHMAEGNWVEGRRTYEAYRRLLCRELGVEPAAELMAGIPVPVEPARPIHGEEPGRPVNGEQPTRGVRSPEPVWRLPTGLVRAPAPAAS